MNKEQLKQLQYLKGEVEIIKNQIENLDYTVATDKVKGSSTHFPYVERSFTITGVDYEDYNRKVERLQRKLNRRADELLDLVEKTNEYIESIDDSFIRQVITLRYVKGLAWELVAKSIGGNNTPDSVRKAAERFLK